MMVKKKGSVKIMPKQIKQKTIELGISENTNKEQWDVINNSIKNASSKNIRFNITVIEE